MLLVFLYILCPGWLEALFVVTACVKASSSNLTDPLMFINFLHLFHLYLRGG